LTPARWLIVNADDFGFTRDVNRGIIEAHRRGILTATTLMANGQAFDDAVALARENPSLDVGCHLVLTGSRSLLPPHLAYPRKVPALLAALALRRIRLYDELAAQLRRILEAGIRPTHLDTHKHVHLLPPVLEVVARLAEKFHIPWIRRPLVFPRRLQGILRRHGCRTTDHFAGYGLTGRLRARQILELIAHLPAGTTELMCHPGRCGPELMAAPTRLKQSREEELEALTAPETRQALAAASIRLGAFRELPSG